MLGYEIKKKPSQKSNQVKKREFSKLILIAISVTVFCVVAFSCVMMWRTMDISPLSYLVPSLFVELTTATGFYYDKAKQENLNKYRTSQEYPSGTNTYQEPET